MTHAELVEIAARWARARYPVVITELQAGDSEYADVIALSGSRSVVIECKTSRADFYRDREKACHRSGRLMGNERYYCAERGLLRYDELPAEHGLIEVAMGKASVLSPAEHRPDADMRRERAVLVSALRRLVGAGCVGISVKVYTKATKCAATLYAEPEERPDGREEG